MFVLLIDSTYVRYLSIAFAIALLGRHKAGIRNCKEGAPAPRSKNLHTYHQMLTFFNLCLKNYLQTLKTHNFLDKIYTACI